LFRSGCEWIGIHGKLNENMISRSAQARGHSAAVDLGPVWSILYLLMAAAAWLVWRQRIHEDLWLALARFMVQLILNGLWSFIFFGLRRPGAALVEIIVLLAAIAMTAMRFAELSRLAFWLMIPYGAWVLYASYLNFGIWRLNKGTA
jgi:tryptophan-rich sensory protein